MAKYGPVCELFAAEEHTLRLMEILGEEYK